MKKRIGVLVIALLCIVGLGVCASLQGCQTTTKNADGSTTTTTDMQATAAGIQLAMTAVEDGFQLWQQIHPQATAEEKAAEQARKDAKQAQLQALLQQLLGGALTPKAAEVAKNVVVSAAAK